MQSAQRRGHALSFAFCDLDGFKGINDRFGHAAGDQAIRAVAEVLREEIRGDDLAGRYGGDEFCLMFPHATAAQATVGLERIREKIADLDLATGDARYTVTVTIGVAELASRDQDVERLMEAADRALYAAKQSGRDRIKVAPADLES